MISQVRYANFGGPRTIRECVRGLRTPMYDSKRPASINMLRIESGDNARESSFFIGERNVSLLKGFEVCRIVADDIGLSSVQASLQFYTANFSAISGLRSVRGNIFGGLYNTYDTLGGLKKAASFFGEDADTKRVLLLSVGNRELDLNLPDTRAVFERFGLAVPESKSFHDFGAVIQMLRVFPDGASLNDVMFLPFELTCPIPKE